MNIFLGASPTGCTNCDRNNDCAVTIDEVQGSVNAFLAGSNTCPTVNTLTTPLAVLGRGSGPAGGQLTVPIALAKKGFNVMTIAPLVFDFNANVLTFLSCSSTDPSKAVVADTPSAGRISLVMLENVFCNPPSDTQLCPPPSLTAIPNGTVVNCTFAVNAGASGVAALPLVTAAMADDQFAEYQAKRCDGSVAVSP